MLDWQLSVSFQAHVKSAHAYHIQLTNYDVDVRWIRNCRLDRIDSRQAVGDGQTLHVYSPGRSTFLRPITNPTQSVNAYLHEEHSCQTSSKLI